jgi:nucleoside-diphosphate-sugar epimerase
VRVFVAGASGAIGRPVVRQLVEAGHEVVGMTRSPEKAGELRTLGANPAVLDALDMDALKGAVVAAQPDVVINQLSSLPDRLNYRRPEETFGATNRLRGEIGPVLAGVAAEAGARRLISQSICFYYASKGKPAHSEDDPLMQLPPDTPGERGMIAVEALERSTLETPGLEGVVLRYGFFYGPGTAYASDGSWAEDVRRRRLPVVGKGTGIFSFIHVDDAASATVAALDHGSGIYNVSDDDPARMADWVPVYAEALGAKPPRRIPLWLARFAGGKQAAVMAERLEGASNEKAKRELRWAPRYQSWRQGFWKGLG